MKTARITSAVALTLGLSAAAIAVVETQGGASTTSAAPISAPMPTVLLPATCCPVATPVAQPEASPAPAPVVSAPASVLGARETLGAPVSPAEPPTSPTGVLLTPAPAPTQQSVLAGNCDVQAVTTEPTINPNQPGSIAPAGTAGGGDLPCSEVPTFESSFPAGTTFTVMPGDPITQTTSSGNEQRVPLP